MKRPMDLHLRATYDRRYNRITLTADSTAHPGLHRQGFYVKLKPGTQSERQLRQAMVDTGAIVLDADGHARGSQLADLMPAELSELVQLLIDSGRSILITGPTNTGKTSLLDACLNHAQASGNRPITLYASLPIEHDLSEGSPRMNILEAPGSLDLVTTMPPDFIANQPISPGMIYAQDELHSRPYVWGDTEHASIAALQARGAAIYAIVHGAANPDFCKAASQHGIPVVLEVTRDTPGTYGYSVYHNGRRLQ